MEFTIRHIIKETPTKEEFLEWKQLADVDKTAFVNTRGKKFKELGLKETIDSMRDDELFELLSNDGFLVKRPILVGDNFVLIGFKKNEWEGLEL